MTTISEILRLIDHYGLPEEVLDIILRKIYSWTPPKVDDQGYVISKVKNTHKCPVDLVLENVVNPFDQWIGQHIARVPAAPAATRRVCLWKSEYYDMKNELLSRLSSITGINDWIRPVGVGWPLLEGVDRHSEEWIGYRSWLHTHPTFVSHLRVQKQRRCCYGHAAACHYERENPKILTDHWSMYELALAYPTLYGKNGWANSLKQKN
jgi:hypothetical protein